ncbi:eukaryotic translation initiation factor 3 subunit J-like [Amphibalanus amphitrite]|uniref:eukaryotic translation initiation factor 3 subunit J-like n=1 Tax=Amphibalanus amphitrite TaxID=1232801 RepID=UPI001C91D609|nr:eukaryotic translation initiation factor 3 subunit J-like [Amphibalanus amphitrite]
MSDDDWESENFKPPTALGTTTGDKWEGEDEEEDAPDDWEAEDDEDKPAVPVVEAPVKKKKSLAERIAEKEAKRREELERRRQEEEEAQRNLSPEEQLAAKARALKMQEDADLEVAMETFGVSKDDMPSSSPLDARPTNKEEFDSYRSALVEKLRSLESSPCYAGFLEDLVRDLCWNMDSDEVKKVSTALNALYNDKVKSKQGKSKKSKKGASLKVEKSAYDDFEDFI